MPRIRITNEDGWSSSHELTDDEEEILIGRMPICGINIGTDKQDVSRKHARLSRIKDTWYIEDLHSRNHTSVNGIILDPERPRQLRHGDWIRICGYDLRYNEFAQNSPESGSVFVRDSPLSAARSSISLADASGADNQARLWLLLDVAQSLKNVLSLDAILEDTLSSLLRIFPAARRGVVGFIEGDEFIPKWWKLRETNKNEAIDVSRTVIRHVANRKEAILMENARAELPDQISILTLRIESLMCAPLMDADDNVFGVFQIDSESTKAFDHDDLILMASVAIQASLAINFTRLHEHALQQKAFEKDLELARDVQNEFLPSEPPSVPGYEFADYYQPARFIGGDYFDYAPLASGKLAIVLADVGGKGAPAALYMARMAMETRACLNEHDDPAEVLTRLNHRLSSRFATFVLCVLDPASHTVTIVNAGHRAPLRRLRNGTVEPLGESLTGFPFSVDEEQSFEAVTVQLLPGESVSIFSDGFEDAYQQETDEYFGINRIEASIRESGDSANDLVTTLVRKAQEFSAGTTQLDDMCIVTMKRIE